MPKTLKDGTEQSYVSFKIESTTYDAFRAIASQDGRSLPNAVRALMRNTVIKHGRDKE